MLVPSLQEVVRFLQGLWILVNPTETFPVVVFDQGVILVAIRIHDKLHADDSLLASGNKLYSFTGPYLFYFDVLFFASYFYNSVPMRGVVELLNKLLRGLELFEVRGEVTFMLFEVNEVHIGLPQSFGWFLAPLLVEVDVLE